MGRRNAQIDPANTGPYGLFPERDRRAPSAGPKTLGDLMLNLSEKGENALICIDKRLHFGKCNSYPLTGAHSERAE